MTERTKGNWTADGLMILDENKQPIAIFALGGRTPGEAYANVDFVFKAVNAHEPLLETLEELIRLHESSEDEESFFKGLEKLIANTRGILEEAK